MGFTPHYAVTGNSYFRMSVPPNQSYGYYNFGEYYNDTGSAKKLNSITVQVATGSGSFTSGQHATGDGRPFTLRIYVNNSSSGIYDDVTITQVSYPASGGWPAGPYQTSTWTFNNPPTVASGSTVQLWWETQDRTDTKVLCWYVPSVSVSVSELNYTVTFDLAGGTRTGGGALTQSVPHGGNATPPTCERTGYDFDGWSGSYTNVTSNRTITAQWSRSYYTVTFDLNGGTRTGGGALSQSVVYGGSATPPTCSRTGYTFVRWDGSYTNVTSNRTITAVWKINTYTVTYNANGGSGAPGNQTKTYGQPLTLSSTTPTALWTITYNANGGTVSPSSKTVIRTFRTWNTRADGTGTNYAAGATYTANADLTLYAQYNDPTAGTLATPSRTNCTFNRWTTSQNGGSTVSSSTTITNNTTLYAFWNYGVFLRGNGGSISMPDGTDYKDVELITNYIAHGSSFTIPNYSVTYNDNGAYDEPSKDFVGWSTSSNGSVQYSNGDSLNITNVTNLYAIFETKSFQVTFVDGFGIHSVVRTVQYGQNAVPPTNEYVQQNWAKPGYTFTGWLGNYNNVTNDRTIIALWGFTPVWMMHNGVWVEYKAREE